MFVCPQDDANGRNVSLPHLDIRTVFKFNLFVYNIHCLNFLDVEHHFNSANIHHRAQIDAGKYGPDNHHNAHRRHEQAYLDVEETRYRTGTHTQHGEHFETNGISRILAGSWFLLFVRNCETLLFHHCLW